MAGPEPPDWMAGTGVQSVTRVGPTADKHRLGCFVFSAGMESLTLRSRQSAGTEDGEQSLRTTQ